MENKEKLKKAFFFAVSNNPNINEDCKKNFEYSNFVYTLCLNSLKKLSDEYEIDSFMRHDMLTVDNIRDNVYKCMVNYDTFIVLIDQDDGTYNANVWFELGIIATQKNKNIILISKDITKNFPFYISDVDVVIIDQPLYEWFDENRKQFDTLDDIVAKPNTFDFSEITNEIQKRCFSRLSKSLEHKLTYGKNPFETQVGLSQLNSLGYGTITKLFEESHIIDLIKKDATVAEFINGEEAAFNALVEAVKNAKDSLRTTRSANQSIVGHHTKQQYHNDFMNALFEKSKELKQFDRLICNNNYAKWLDVRDMLLKGGKNTRVFIRKRYYSLGFELVVIDEKISFIHFYQLNDSSGYLISNISSKPNEYDETINSTLKIKGSYVSKHLADLFDRFHHRDFIKKNPNRPSSTILGMPYDKDSPEIPKDIGCLKLPIDILKKIDITANEEEKKELVNEYLWERFNVWYKEMTVKDRVIMGVGISSLNPDRYAKKIIEDLKKYFPIDNKKGKEDREKEKNGRDSFKTELEKAIGTERYTKILNAINIENQEKIRNKYNSIRKKQNDSKSGKNNNHSNYYTIVQNEEVTDDDITQALELDRKIYKIPDGEQFDITKCKNWNEKTGQQVYTIIKDPITKKVVGYINAVPVNDKCYEEIKAGKYADVEINDEDIVAYEYYPTRPQKYNLYFASIVVDSKKDLFRRSYELYNAFLNKIIIFTQINIIFSRMIADAISDEGKQLCENSGMKKIKDTNHDNSTIYEMELYPPNFSAVRKEKLKELYDVLMAKYKEIGEIDD